MFNILCGFCRTFLLLLLPCFCLGVISNRILQYVVSIPGGPSWFSFSELSDVYVLGLRENVFDQDDPLTVDALLNWQPPTLWEQVKLSPLLFLSWLLYTPPTQFNHQPDKIHIICISDNHNSQPPVPNGDILIHAGDLTVCGTTRKHELDKILSWFQSQPHPHKFFIGGNHDTQAVLLWILRYMGISHRHTQVLLISKEYSTQVVARYAFTVVHTPLISY